MNITKYILHKFEGQPKQNQMMRFRAPKTGLKPIWDLNITNFLFQNSSLSELTQNLNQAILHSEINHVIVASLQELLKLFLTISPPLKLEDFPNQEDIVVARWLLLSYGGQNLWNEYCKMVTKQVKLMDDAIDNQKELDEIKRMAGWPMYYWDMLQEDMGFAKKGGPKLEGERDERKRVEVRNSNFGKSEELVMSYENLLKEIIRVCWRIDEVKKKIAREKTAGRVVVKDFADPREISGNEDTDTSRKQTRSSPPLLSVHPSTTSKSGLQATEEVGKSSGEPKLTKPPLPKAQDATPTDNNKVASVAHVPQIPQESSEEQAEAKESRFYEAPEQWVDMSSQGAEFINDGNESMGNNHNFENHFGEMTADEIPSETGDYEELGGTEDHQRHRHSSRNRERQGNDHAFQHAPNGGLFIEAPPPISDQTPRQQPLANLFQPASSLLHQCSSRHPLDQENSQPSSSHSEDSSSSRGHAGHHGSHAHSSRDRERGDEREKEKGNKERERKYSLHKAEVGNYERAKAWDEEEAKQKERERASQHQALQTTTPRPSTSRIQSNYALESVQKTIQYQNPPSHYHQSLQPPHATHFPQQVLIPQQPAPQEEKVTPRAPQNAMRSWRNNRPGPNKPPPHHVQPRNSILKKRSEDEFSHMGRGKPKGPPTGRHINFTASVKREDGGRPGGTKAFEKAVKDLQLELYD